MITTYRLTIAAIKMFVRNRQALFFTLFTPLMIMVIFGFIGFDRPTTFDVGLVAVNPAPPTQQFIDQLKQFPSVKIHEGNLNDELTQLDQGNRAVVLEVPSDFLVVNPPPRSPHVITAHVNEGQQAQAQTVLSILSQYLDNTSLALAKAPTYFSIQQQTVNAHNLRYIEFLLPGLIALSVMQMSVFSVAFVFVQYKEKGVLKRLLATPMKPSQFVAANTITRLLVALAQSAIFIGVGVWLFKVSIIGSYWLIFLCVVLGALMFLGLGFTVSGLSKTTDSVPAIANLIVFPMLFLGGTFFPISSMPIWLQNIAKYLPLTYFSTALRDVMTQGASLYDIRWNLLAMIIWAIILIALATYTFSFQEKQST